MIRRGSVSQSNPKASVVIEGDSSPPLVWIRREIFGRPTSKNLSNNCMHAYTYTFYSTETCAHLLYHVCVYFGLETYIARHISNIILFDLMPMTNDLRDSVLN